MLVCSVSQLRRRAAIAAGLTEAAAALDNPGTGNVVFATLVDDPASVGDHIDAFLGQIMVEAASAAATVNGGLAYAAAVVEVVSAAATVNASVSYAVAIVEAATAADAPLGSVVAPSIYTVAVVEAVTAADAPDATLASAVMRNAAIAGLSPLQVNSGVPPIKSARVSSGTALGA
jgi:hypothetical protein